MSEETSTIISPAAQPQVGANSETALQCSSLACDEIRNLLDSSPPSDTEILAYGPWRSVVEELHESYRAGGTKQVRQTFNALAATDTAVVQLVAEDTRSASAPNPETAQDAKVPLLPSYAQLTSHQEAEAQSAGQWLDDYVAFASQASPLTPKSFHVAAALFALSLAVARRLYVAVSTEANWIWPNLYLLFVGPSTRPRKTTAMRVLRGLLHQAGMDYFLLADRQTPEALGLDLTPRIPPSFDKLSQQEQDRWLRERAIAAQRGWLLEEASHLLDSFKRDYSSGLLPLVLDLYDASAQGPSRNTVNRGRESVERPYLSIFGCSTYAAMASHVKNDAHWHNGLWARFSFITSDTDGKWKFWPPSLPYPGNLVARLKSIAVDLLPMPSVRLEARDVQDADTGEQRKVMVVVVDPPLTASCVAIDQEAYNQWERYSRAVTYDMLPGEGGDVSPQFYASYGRLGTALIKVAMLLATADAESLPVKVEARHLYRAQMIVETWRENLHDILGKVSESNAHDDSHQLAGAITTYLAEQGRDWTSRRNLLRKLGKTWSEIEGIIDDLEQSEVIERKPSTGSRGKQSEEYRLYVPEDEPQAELSNRQ